MLYFAAASATTGNVNVTVDTTGGFLYGTFTVNFKTGATSNGKVTGGTGSFVGATGTIKAKNHLQHHARGHDHLQQLAKHDSLMEAGRSAAGTVPPY